MPEILIKKKKLFTALFVVILLGIMFVLSFFSALGDSGTVDEVAHIPAGYSYVEHQDFRLNPEHPPLAKALAGMPLALAGINDIKADWSWEQINQWESGWYLLYEAGNDPAYILLLSRLPMMALMLLLGLVVFFMAKKYFGTKVALFALALYAFYPEMIGHGHLVTTDIAAALGYVIAVWAFSNALVKKSLKTMLIAALAFGVAQLLKFSSFLLFGIFLILIVGKAWQDKTKEANFWVQLWKHFKTYFWVCLLSLIVVWIVYIPFVLNTTPEVEHKVIEMNLTQRADTLAFRNFLHLFENNLVLRALGHYLLGVMLVVARVAGGNAVFIMGQLSDKSIAWFFPVAYLIKTPITILILLVWSIVTFIVFRNKNKKESWADWVILTPLVVYWLFTLQGSLNIGIRHLIPTVPFAILFIAKQMHRYIGEQEKFNLQAIVVWTLAGLMAISTIAYFPSYIAYFNEAVPRSERYKYMTDSSLDWGQDLLRLKKYVDEENIETIKVDYFGGSVPEHYMPQAVEWHSSYGPTTGYLAISATYYQSSKLYGPIEGKWSYEWLDDYEPDAVIGGSILIFNITATDLSAKPPISPYEITHVDPPGSLDIDRGTPN